MTDVNKAIKPVESTIIAPLNDGAKYQTNNFIQFTIGASQLNMWLVNSSYLSLDLVYTSKTNPYGAAKTSLCPSYIKNACNLFSSIEVLYAGDTIYSQPYNIEQNTLKQLYYGEDYLKNNYMTFTTREMILADMQNMNITGPAAAHLYPVENRLYAGQTAYLKLRNDATNGGKLGGADTQTIRNIMIPINQLIPFFMDMGSEGFPVRCMKNQIEIRLYIAEPYRYLVDWDPVNKDFSDTLYIDNSSDHNVANIQETPISARYGNTDIEFKNVRMFCQHYLPDAGLAARIDNECLNSPEGKQYGFVRTEIAQRQINKINLTNNIPLTCATNNTQNLMLFCYKTGISPGVMYRPLINSLYIKFGSNQLPFQPIPGDSFTAPFEYKFLTDDVLNMIDTYNSETNHDYNASYRYIDIPDGATARPTPTIPTSSFVLMGANYVSDPDAIGACSTLWNSAYQVSFNAKFEDATPLTVILGVESKWGLLFQNGKLTTINI